MNGIFNYQVPGRAPTVNENTNKNNNNISANNRSKFQDDHGGKAESLANNQSLIMNLLQALLLKLGLADGDKTPTPPKLDHNPSTKPSRGDNNQGANPCGVTTLAVGEEDGGTATTKAIGEEDGGSVTTLAIGEEDGGIATTLAIGEDGGGIATTQAVGEEDGGTATTKAIGEEDGGSVTTLAIGEEDGGLAKN